MAKRFLTYFGVAIPPYKEDKFGATSTTIRFVLNTKIVSKKNNQQAVTIRKIARDWANKQSKLRQPSWADVHKAISMCSSKIRGNKDYKDFVKANKPVIQKQMNFWVEKLQDKGLVFPLQKATMTLKFYFKNKYITDTVNKQQSVQDLLVECGVIANDDYKTLNPIHSQSACFYEEIIQDIAFISLTINLK